MKKLITIITLVMALCLMSVSSFAAELNLDNPTGNATAYYTIGDIANENDVDDPTDDEISGTYTVTIPEYITTVAKNETPINHTVEATEVLLQPKEVLSVSCEYSNELALASDSTVKIGYQMQNKGANFNSGAVVLEAEAGDPTATYSTTIGSVLTESPIYAGVYTDTATFTCSVA